jgi:hypothetical protein
VKSGTVGNVGGSTIAILGYWEGKFEREILEENISTIILNFFKLN